MHLAQSESRFVQLAQSSLAAASPPTEGCVTRLTLLIALSSCATLLLPLVPVILSIHKQLSRVKQVNSWSIELTWWPSLAVIVELLFRCSLSIILVHILTSTGLLTASIYTQELLQLLHDNSSSPG